MFEKINIKNNFFNFFYIYTNYCLHSRFQQQISFSKAYYHGCAIKIISRKQRNRSFKYLLAQLRGLLRYYNQPVDVK